MKFKEAYELPIGEHVEKKGQFSYLSWPYAVKFLRENFPQATWIVRDYDGVPYKVTPAGCFVEVSVILDGLKFSQTHPVLNYQNKTIATPDAFQVNTSIQRCLAKAIGIATGIGLGLYAGEDLPTENRRDKNSKQAEKYISKEQEAQIKNGLAAVGGDPDKFLVWLKAKNFSEILEGQFKMAMAQINKKADEGKND